VVACDQADVGRSTGIEEDVRDEWADPEFERWVADDAELGIAAFVQAWHREPLRTWGFGWVHPERRGGDLGRALVRQVEEAAVARGARRVVGYILGADVAAAALLGDTGYEHVRSYWRMGIEQLRAPDRVEVPGILLEPFRLGEDERGVHAALEEAFADEWGHVAQPLDNWLRLLDRPGFDPELWIVARDGGEVAGAALGWVHLEGGFVDYISVRRPWRGRGLGLALLRETFGAFWRKGRPDVELNVDTANQTGAPRLYDRAGMHALYRTERHEKDVR
jgi:mycothiol synthase